MGLAIKILIHLVVHLRSTFIGIVFYMYMRSYDEKPHMGQENLSTSVESKYLYLLILRLLVSFYVKRYSIKYSQQNGRSLGLNKALVYIDIMNIIKTIVLESQ